MFQKLCFAYCKLENLVDVLHDTINLRGTFDLLILLDNVVFVVVVVVSFLIGA